MAEVRKRLFYSKNSKVITIYSDNTKKERYVNLHDLCLSDCTVLVTNNLEFNQVKNNLTSLGYYSYDLFMYDSKRGYISISYGVKIDWEYYHVRNPFNKPTYCYSINFSSYLNGLCILLSLSDYLELIEIKLEEKAKRKQFKQKQEKFNSLSFEEKLKYFSHLDITHINKTIIENLHLLIFTKSDEFEETINSKYYFNKLQNDTRQVLHKLVPLKNDDIIEIDAIDNELELYLDITKYFFIIAPKFYNITRPLSCNLTFNETLKMIDVCPQLLDSPKETSILLVIKSQFDSVINNIKKLGIDITIRELMKYLKNEDNINYKNTYKAYNLLISNNHI